MIKIVFLFIFSITNIVGQTSNKELKFIWENTKNIDSIRFNALAQYYIKNNQAQPDSSLVVLDYYYKLAKEKNNIMLVTVAKIMSLIIFDSIFIFNK